MWPFPVFGNAALAMLIERFAGYPQQLHDRIGHPVEWMGRLITFLEQSLNRTVVQPAEGRLRGLIALGLLIAAAGIPAIIIAGILRSWSGGWIIEILLATSLVAQKSMREHVMDVHRALGQSLTEARSSVAKIVGRDPSQLDESGISKAALESLAENTSDGIVAPIFWYALLGLPGIVVYKAINTADSMIGHMSDRYRHFGWAAAKLDDLVNLPCSRLTGFLFAAAVPHRFREIAAVMKRDAPKHQSPNAGWPEAALAAALSVRLGGPRSYGGQPVDLAWMGEGRTQLERHDIKRGLRLFNRAMWMLFGNLAIIALAT